MVIRRRYYHDCTPRRILLSLGGAGIRCRIWELNSTTNKAGSRIVAGWLLRISRADRAGLNIRSGFMYLANAATSSSALGT